MFKNTAAAIANDATPDSAYDRLKEVAAASTWDEIPAAERQRMALEERAAFNYVLRLGLIIGASATSLLAFALGLLSGFVLWHH